MGKLEGKVALITGAARGQGRAHAVRLAEEGANIIALDICAQLDSVPYPMSTLDDLAETASLVEGLGRKVVTGRADVRERVELTEAVKAGVEALGRLDIVVANAGIMALDANEPDEDRAWHDSIDVMLTGVWHTLRATVATMIEQAQGGSIVVTSSLAGLKAAGAGLGGLDGYQAAKHGVVGLVRGYASTLALHNIRVNSIHPSAVMTPMIMNEALARFGEKYPDFLTRLGSALPIPAMEPQDVSNAVLWLVSDDARYITGVTLPVDGGAMIL